MLQDVLEAFFIDMRDVLFYFPKGFRIASIRSKASLKWILLMVSPVLDKPDRIALSNDFSSALAIALMSDWLTSTLVLETKRLN